MEWMMGKKEDEESDINDLILLSVCMLVVVCLLTVAYLFSKRFFPNLHEKISGILR
jgi:hypothetical protein